MCLAGDADDHGSLLDGFLCVFNLEDAALGRAGSMLASERAPTDGISVQGDGVVVVLVAEHGCCLFLSWVVIRSFASRLFEMKGVCSGTQACPNR